MNEERKVNDAFDEEKMKIKFRKFRKIIQTIEVAFMILPVVLIVIFVLSLGVLIAGSSIDKESSTNETVVESNTDEISEEDTNDLANEDESGITSIISAILLIVNWVISVILMDHLRKIFYEVETLGTPFTEKNVMYIDKISKLTIVLGILRIISLIISNSEFGASLVFIIIILAISSVFKYGYKLQKESDETL
jgi:NADH:ubiquinone oxidoreductase subunit 5 (subunit L)/multisubunit Na+/H+ antiporter MnhA subunit